MRKAQTAEPASRLHSETPFVDALTESRKRADGASQLERSRVPRRARHKPPQQNKPENHNMSLRESSPSHQSHRSHGRRFHQLVSQPERSKRRARRLQKQRRRGRLLCKAFKSWHAFTVRIKRFVRKARGLKGAGSNTGACSLKQRPLWEGRFDTQGSTTPDSSFGVENNGSATHPPERDDDGLPRQAVVGAVYKPAVIIIKHLFCFCAFSLLLTGRESSRKLFQRRRVLVWRPGISARSSFLDERTAN